MKSTIFKYNFCFLVAVYAADYAPVLDYVYSSSRFYSYVGIRLDGVRLGAQEVLPSVETLKEHLTPLVCIERQAFAHPTTSSTSPDNGSREVSSSVRALLTPQRRSHTGSLEAQSTSSDSFYLCGSLVTLCAFHSVHRSPAYIIWREQKLVYYANFQYRHGPTRSLPFGMEDFLSIITERDERCTANSF